MVTAEWDFVDTKSEQCPTLYPERPDQTRRTTRKRARRSGRPGGDRRSGDFQAYVSSMVWQWRRGKGDNLNLFNVSLGQWVNFAQEHQEILEKAYDDLTHFAHFTMSGVKYEVDMVLEQQMNTQTRTKRCVVFEIRLSAGCGTRQRRHDWG